MSSDDDRIEALEARLRELESQQDELRTQLAQAEIDQWRGRIEDLEVQLDLGSMETRDRLAPLVEELRNRWLDGKAQADKAASSASGVVDALRTGLEQAMDDIRSAVSSAKDRM